MKVGIVGAGAIGGYVAAKLALAGASVTAIIRGANLAALKAKIILLALQMFNAWRTASCLPL